MKINEVINNVEVFGIESAIRGSKYPMATDLTKVTDDATPTTYKLANSKLGEGHDNFLKWYSCSI